MKLSASELKMFETDEVDDDYFTPATSTSLANIFGKPVQQQGSDNKSLKYTPPKSQNIVPKSEEEPKSSECLFACALIGYEWFNNTYTSRGKLGFAIMKMLKSGLHNIILYDANKTTLSYTTVTPQLEMTVNENTFISYYDNNKKYWSIYATEVEIKNIEELLNILNVVVKYASGKGEGPPEPYHQDHNLSSKIVEKDKETDTDSSTMKKTKKSILNRMASMGQSVLPPNTLLTEKASDSSDTTDSVDHPKAVRHKTNKSFVKRSIPDKQVSETQILCESHKQLPSPKSYRQPTEIPRFTCVNNQLVPVTHTNIISSSNNCDMNIYMSEQRICNSELRMNMNRITDKIDHIANKVTDLESKNKEVTNNFQMEILQKLLTEYETKIKCYEEIMKSKGITQIQMESKSIEEKRPNEIEALLIKITNLEEINKEKSCEIIKLEDEINLLKHNIDILNSENDKENKKYTQKITQLENDLVFQSNEIITISRDLKHSQSNIENKLKIIMNDTFQAICGNFENNESYTGESIKSVIATVIKKVTADCLSEL